MAILIIGAFEIAVGIARHPPVWLRASIIGLGILTIILSGIVIVYTSVAQGILAALLALALLFVGMRNLVHGITGHHPVAAPIDSQITSA